MQIKDALNIADNLIDFTNGYEDYGGVMVFEQLDWIFSLSTLMGLYWHGLSSNHRSA